MSSNHYLITNCLQKRQVGWTAASTSSSSPDNKSRNIRPMHVRLSVRIHHISFLHPGLDPGGATLTTNRGRKKIRLKKKDELVGVTPGPLAFGSRRGSWKNPNKGSSSGNKSKKSGNNYDNHYDNAVELEKNGSDNAAEVSEIISSEAFRLSRDGIIQQHYALTRGSSEEKTPSSSSPSNGGVMSPRAADMAETVRYYKECAQRPKGYRRLVVSSMIPLEDDKIPPPPPTVKSDSMWSGKSSRGLNHGGGAFEKYVLKPEEKDLFDDVEYRHVGPPNVSNIIYCLNFLHNSIA